MQKHPDFGRGRLRYNLQNKRRMDEMWTTITYGLNSTGCGPKKSAKEWGKTWRDWKSNVLKKKATQKSYMSGTGGGSPKELKTTELENDLLEFLSPDASGLSGIPEGGLNDIVPPLSTFQQKNLFTMPSSSDTGKSTWTEREAMEKIALPHNSPAEMSLFTMPSSSDTGKSTWTEREAMEKIALPHNSPAEMPLRNRSSVENIIPNSTLKDRRGTKRIRLDSGGNLNKAQERKALLTMMDSHTTGTSEYQNKILLLKEEKLALAREQLAFQKRSHEELKENMRNIQEAIISLQNTIQDMGPQYLDM